MAEQAVRWAYACVPLMLLGILANCGMRGPVLALVGLGATYLHHEGQQGRRHGEERL